MHSSITPLAIAPGQGGLDCFQLCAPNGASVCIYLQGAHVSSWQVPILGEQLFMSGEAQFAPGKALRGGVPVIFPQFGVFGPGGKHGFARNLPWRLNAAASSAQVAVLDLQSDDQTLAAWPFAFRAQLQVSLGEQDLQLTLTITNRDTQAFEFTSALHSYFAVADLQHTAIHGLSGLSYWDNGTAFTERYEDNQPSLEVRDALDRVYFGAVAPLELRQPHQVLAICSKGFRDAVVWNPGRLGAAALPDMADAEFNRMLCIESAVVDQPTQLAPGESWTGEQLLAVRPA